jgi:sirohydrochlorin ferrochelatase
VDEINLPRDVINTVERVGEAISGRPKLGQVSAATGWRPSGISATEHVNLRSLFPLERGSAGGTAFPTQAIPEQADSWLQRVRRSQGRRLVLVSQLLFSQMIELLVAPLRFAGLLPEFVGAGLYLLLT